ALLEGAGALLAGVDERGLTAGGALLVEISADLDEPLGVGEVGDLNLGAALGRGRAGRIVEDAAVLGDADVGRAGGNGDGRIELVSAGISHDDVSVGVCGEASGPRVGQTIALG